MKQYKTEAHFNREVVAFLRSQGCKVQRIESGMTGRGIPDIYVASEGIMTWLEGKRTKHRFDGTARHIKWRAGQQAWMLDHFMRSKRVCWTLCAFSDCIIALPQVRIYRPFDRLNGCIRVHSVYELFVQMDRWLDKHGKLCYN